MTVEKVEKKVEKGKTKSIIQADGDIYFSIKPLDTDAILLKRKEILIVDFDIYVRKIDTYKEINLSIVRD